MSDTGASTASHARRGLQLFRVAGIRIRLDYSWILIFALVLWSLSAGYFPGEFPGLTTAQYWLAGLAATLAFFASILIHELAHALVAQRHGLEIPNITLFLFGGVSEMEEEPADPRVEAQIAAAGPLTSFALAFAFGLAHRASGGAPELVSAVFGYLAWINAALGVFNLLPGYPLDGGRVLRAYLWHRNGDLQAATRTASNVGKGLAVGLMVLGGLEIFAGALVGGLWLILIGLFLRGVADASYRALVTRQLLREASVREAMTRDPEVVQAGTTIAELIEDHILAHGHRAFPVVEGEKVLGLISVEDAREVEREKRESERVEEHMMRLGDELRISVDTSLEEALRRLSQVRGARLLVMDGERLQGLLSANSLARLSELREMFPASAREEAPA